MADDYVTRKTLLQRASDQDDAGAWEEFVGYYRNFILMLLRYMNVAPGAQCDAPVSGVDFLPTIAELAGLGTLETAQPLDGRSFASLLREGNAASDAAEFDQRAMIWYFPKMGKWEMNRPGSAVRRDGWKLVHTWKDNRFCLYHVGDDPSESKDLMASAPERAEALKNELFAYLRAVGQEVEPGKKEK